MIRLPPTAILLGRCDLKEFDRRQKLREIESETETVKQEFARFEVGGHDGPSFACQKKPRTTPQENETHNKYDRAESSSHIRPLTLQIAGSSGLDLQSRDEPSPSILATPDNEETHAAHPPVDEHTYVSIEVDGYPENLAIKIERASSPSKDDFYFGGFTESPIQRTTDNTPCSLSFAPEDSSTPQNIQLPETRMLRARRTLPRSPLFAAYNASTSPEHRATSGLTPRVASSVATHHTPGNFFAQPARRPPRRIPRTFRHQTNSFSFDSSERASAAYEQRLVSSTSTIDSVQWPTGNLNLHEELRGSSLESSRTPSVITTSTQADKDESMLSFSRGYAATNTDRTFIFSSPQLPLPPPFSTVSRSVSRAHSLPSLPDREYSVQNLSASPVRSPSESPLQSGVEGRHPSPNPEVVEHDAEVGSSPPSNNGNSPLNVLRSVARRIASYRARTPVSSHGSSAHPSPSPSPSPTPCQSQGRESSITTNNQSPSRTYQVYNDELPPSFQPQTPAHLPEARHQSRFHPSYTAPVTRAGDRDAAPFLQSGGAVNLQTSGHRLQPNFSTPSRRGGRTDSPPGLLNDGFRGLYGGRENGDEEQNWVEGVRFNNAEVRLWGLREARDDGRSLNVTPEREEWRVGRRE